MLTHNDVPHALETILAWQQSFDARYSKLIASYAQPQEEEDQYLNVKETAAFLKLSVPTIYSKISLRELPVCKRGNRCYFSKRELTDYLKQGRKKTTEEVYTEASNYTANRKVLASNPTNHN